MRQDLQHPDLTFNTRLMYMERVTPLILFVGAFVVRLIKLEQNGLWGDELAQVMLAQGTVWQVIKDAVEHTGGTPLDYLITHFSLRFLGNSETMLRLPDVLWGSLTVMLMFYLGRRLFNPITGTLAAFILLIMPLHVEYSREMRFYALPTLLILLSVYLLHVAISRTRWYWWVAYGVVAVLGLYTHFYTAIALALEGIWVLLFYWRQRNILARFIATGAVVFLVFLPWAIFFLAHPILPPNFSWYNNPSFTEVMSAPFFDPLPGGNAALLSGANSDALRNTYIAYIQTMVILIVMYGSLLMLGCYIILRKHGTKTFVAHLSLLLILSLAGMGTAFLLTVVSRYFFAARQMLFYTPPLILAASAIVVHILYTMIRTRPGIAPRRRGVIIVAAGTLLFAIVNLYVLWKPLTDLYTPYKQDWRGVARYLLHHMDPQDILLTDYPDYLGFYAPEIRPQMSASVDRPALYQLITAHPHIWILSMPSGLFPKLAPHMTQWVEEHHSFEALETPDFLLYRYDSGDMDTF